MLIGILKAVAAVRAVSGVCHLYAVCAVRNAG